MNTTTRTLSLNRVANKYKNDLENYKEEFPENELRAALKKDHITFIRDFIKEYPQYERIFFTLLKETGVRCYVKEITQNHEERFTNFQEMYNESIISFMKLHIKEEIKIYLSRKINIDKKI